MILSVFIVLFCALDINISFNDCVFILRQVIFPTFDPPKIPAHMGGVGHWVSIFLDLKAERF